MRPRQSCGRPAHSAISLCAAYDAPWSVDFTTVDGTATAGSDYQAVSGTLTFAPGETSKTFTVLVNGDRLSEPIESFYVHVSAAEGTRIEISQGVGTILNDDGGKGGGKGAKTKLTTSSTLTKATEPVLLSTSASDFDLADADESGRLFNPIAPAAFTGLNITVKGSLSIPELRVFDGRTSRDHGPAIDTALSDGGVSRSLDEVWSDLQLWDELLA